MVPQRLLEDYELAKERLRDAERMKSRIRERILQLAGPDAQHEPGPLVLVVRQQQSRRLSREAVISAFGPEMYERLIARIAPTTQLVMSVRVPPETLEVRADTVSARQSNSRE